MKKLYEFVGMLVLNGYSLDSGEIGYYGDIRRYKWMKLRKRVWPVDYYCTVDCEKETYVFSQKNVETGEGKEEEEMRI